MQGFAEMSTSVNKLFYCGWPASLMPHCSPSTLTWTLFRQPTLLSLSLKGPWLFSVTLCTKALTCESVVDPRRTTVWASVKSDDLTACLSALLTQDECAREALEDSSLPVTRGAKWGAARVFLPPSSSDPWGVCGRKRRLRKQEVWRYELFNAFKSSPTVRSSQRERGVDKIIFKEPQLQHNQSMRFFWRIMAWWCLF